MRPGALPLPQIILIDLTAPPVLAGLWWLMARGWAGTVQRGGVNQATKAIQAQAFWAFLVLFYLIFAGCTLYYGLTT